MSRAPRRQPVGNPLARRQQWRLMVLVMGLGMVLVVMGRLRQPDVATALGRLFGLADRDAIAPPRDISDREIAQLLESESGIDAPPDAVRMMPARGGPADVAAETSSADSPLALDPEMLAVIEDNTRFRRAESEAWFQVLSILRSHDPASIAAESIGSISYVQLLRQPGIYRGRVVTVVGTARQSIETSPGENKLGLDAYHRLVIKPEGGSWPVVVYALELPDQFPVATAIDEPVTATGFFFKNWSYLAEDKLGLAPVVLVRTIQWNRDVSADRAAAAAAAADATSEGTVWVVFGAAVAAGLVTLYLWRRTAWMARHKRRPLPDRLDVDRLLSAEN